MVGMSEWHGFKATELLPLQGDLRTEKRREEKRIMALEGKSVMMMQLLVYYTRKSRKNRRKLNRHDASISI